MIYTKEYNVMKRLKIGLAGSMQLNFAGGAGGGRDRIFEQSAEKIKALANEFEYDCFVYPNLLLTGADAAKAREIFQQENVDFVLLQITTFSAGEVVINLAKVNAAFGLWALPESSMKDSIFINSLNSFCGINMYSSIIINYLKDFSINHKWFYGNCGDEMFINRFKVTVKALTAVKNLRASKVALVGGIAPGFNDLYFDERPGQKRLGLQIERNHEFSEIQRRAEAYSVSEIEKFIETSSSKRFDTSDASKKNLDVHTRYYKAYKDFSGDYGYDALAVSCWPQMKDASGAYSCSIVSKLNQDGIIAACEGDLPGAISMLLQKYIIKAPTTLMDLSGIDEEDQTVLMWHCGPSPEYYANSAGACLQYCRQPCHNGEEDITGMITNMLFEPQHITFMRITGEWNRIFLLDGKITGRQKDSPQGSRGWVEALRLNRKEISVRDLVNTILVQGMQHHYPMAAGDITEELMEAAAWLGLKPVEAIAYENYLQVRD
jgi:L-fucose isomerase-like protein